jgi:6-phosphogluconolactonase (cycloisomerase 2 family)
MKALRLSAPVLLLSLLGVVALAGCGRTKGIFRGSSTTTTGGPFLYVTNSDGKVSEFAIGGTGALSLVGTVSAGSASGPVGIAALLNSGSSGTENFVYVVNSADSKVHEFSVDPSSGKLTSIGSIAAGSSSGPVSVVVDGIRGLAYVANQTSGTIVGFSINPSSGLLSSIGTVMSALLSPQGMAVSPDGNFVYAVENGRGVVDAFGVLSNGSLSFINSTPSLGTTNGAPNQVIVNSLETFAYASDSAGPAVTQFSIVSGGGLSPVFAFATSASGDQPIGLAIDPSGNFLYTANFGTNTVTIFQINTSNGGLTRLGPTSTASLSQPKGIAIDLTGSFVYVANQGSGTVALFTIQTGGTLALSGSFATESPANPSSGPQFIAIVP